MHHAVPLLAATSLLATNTWAQDVDENDIPQQCHAACDPVHTLTQQCDDDNDGDQAYIDCVCGGQNATALLPACEACFSASGDTDNDVRDLLSSCSLSTTTYNPAAAAPTMASIGNMGTNGTNPTMVMTTTGSAGPTTITSVAPTNSGSGAGSGSGSGAGSNSGSSTPVVSQQTGNAAPVVTGGAMAGLGLFVAAAIGAL